LLFRGFGASNFTIGLVLMSMPSAISFCIGPIISCKSDRHRSRVLPQALMGRFYGLFRAVSLIDGVLFNYFIIGHAEEYYLFILTGMGLIYGTIFIIMCLNVKEGTYPPPIPAAAGRIAAIKSYFSDCYSNPYYLLMFAYFTLTALALNSFGPFAILYAKQLNVPMAQYGKAAAVMLAVSLVLSYFLGAVADRFHPLRAALVALFLYGAVLTGGYFLVTDARSFLIVFAMQGIIAGGYSTVGASLPMRVLPRAAFAQFSSAAALAPHFFRSYTSRVWASFSPLPIINTFTPF
jgi:hypothetical protein